MSNIVSKLRLSLKNAMLIKEKSVGGFGPGTCCFFKIVFNHAGFQRFQSI